MPQKDVPSVVTVIEKDQIETTTGVDLTGTLKKWFNRCDPILGSTFWYKYEGF